MAGRWGPLTAAGRSVDELVATQHRRVIRELGGARQLGVYDGDDEAPIHDDDEQDDDYDYHENAAGDDVIEIQSLLEAVLLSEAAVHKLRTDIRAKYRTCQKLMMGCWQLVEETATAETVRADVDGCRQWPIDWA
jgi:hypothetical protein